MREEKSGTRYFSFQELPNVSKPKKKKVDTEIQEKFVGNCKICGNLMHYVEGTNVIVCNAPDCGGYKKKTNKKNKKKDKEEMNNFVPVFRILYGKNKKIAQSLFND